jgi:hypothetical protein
MSEHRLFSWADGSDRKGGYPAGSKPVSEIKPPPPSVTKPKPKVSR